MTSITRSVGLAVGRSIGAFPVIAMLTVLATMLVGDAPLAGQTKLTVAAAANLGPALQEIATSYGKRSGTELALVFGSSGNLATQIEHGAPYDVFLSADMGYPERLAQGGLGVRESLRPYAVGRLVLWVRKDSGIELDRLGERVLLDPQVRKIAMANPQHAPYGKAAETYLRNAKLSEKVKNKLVMGEDVAQTAQFVISGNAQIGMVPLSLALAPKMLEAGRYYRLGKEAPAVEQGAIILTRSANRQAAAEFLDFLRSPEVVAIWQKYGYAMPEAAP